MGQLTEARNPGEAELPTRPDVAPAARGRSAVRRIPQVRSRPILAGLVAVVAIVAVVLVVTLNSRSDDVVATPGVAATSGTDRVKVRDLVVTEEVKGDLGHADERDLSAHRTGIVTSLAAVASTVKPGKQLYAIGLEPTILLVGSTPAYRTLDLDSSNGPDIRQLERALTDLGYGDDLTVDRNFTAATAAAVEEWEQDLGRDDPDGTVELGDIVFAPAAVRIATHPVSVGTEVQTTTAVIGLSATTKVANVDLSIAKSNTVAIKDLVTVTLPNGTETAGRIAGVGTEPQTSAADPTADPTVPMVITLTDPEAAADFDNGSVTVSIEQSRTDNVLTVPVTALIALAEGGYAVQVVDPAAAAGYRLVAVETGTVTEEYAAITGNGITDGLEVVVAK